MKKWFALIFALAFFIPISVSAIQTIEVSIIPGSSVSTFCGAFRPCYVPARAEIDRGGTVTWKNDDTAAHTVTSGSPIEGPDGEFDSSLFMSGITYTHQFNQDGIYPYFCTIHPWMVGTVIVGDVDEDFDKPILSVPSFDQDEDEDELEELKEENKFLKKEISSLKTQIERLEKQISTLQEEIEKLNQIIFEQIQVIYNWVLSR